VNSEHIQIDAVKDYLLGTLPDDQASAIEERYFTDPAFFNEIRRMEIDLICQFLDKKLTKEEQEQFNRRYLRTPRLKRLVDEVREQREKNIPRFQSIALRVSVAAALVCIAVIGFVVLRKGPAPPVQKASAETRLSAAVTLFLEPGVTMGAGSETRQLVLQSQAQTIALVADLPGQIAPADYVARVLSIGRDGSRQSVFSSGQIRSVPRTGGQQVTVMLSSTELPPGDYMMELQRTEGKVSGAYVFRVTAARE
jgi:anti-sigma factor RsiW